MTIALKKGAPLAVDWMPPTLEVALSLERLLVVEFKEAIGVGSGFACLVLPDLSPAPAADFTDLERFSGLLVLRQSQLLDASTLLCAASCSRPSRLVCACVETAEAIAFLAGVMAVVARLPDRGHLILVHSVQLKLLRFAARSLPASLVRRIGFLVLAPPETLLPDAGLNTDRLLAIVRKLPTYLRLESRCGRPAIGRVASCRAFAAAFRYADHDDTASGLAPVLDLCLAGRQDCATCKAGLTRILLARAAASLGHEGVPGRE